MEKINILLVASPVTDIGFGRAMCIPNLGLASIAANTDHNLCTCKILDLAVKPRKAMTILKETIAEFKPQVIGFSAMTFQFANTVELAQQVRNIDSSITLVLGGYHATTAIDEIMSHERHRNLFDFFVRHEGEMAFQKLVEAILNKRAFATVPNLSYLKDNKVVHTPREIINDLSAISPPERNARIFNKGFYLFGYPADVIETSRGCPYTCEFCSIRNMYGSSYRTYTIDRVIADIKDARAHGAKGIFFADDNIAMKGERFKQLCTRIIEEKLNNIGYFIQASVRGLRETKGLIPLMQKAGVQVAFLGIENASDENLASFQKDNQFKSSDVCTVVQELKKSKIVTIGGFIIGHPDDTEQTIRANYTFAKNCGIDVALFFILTPFPKTETRAKLLSQNLITNIDDYTQYTCFNACVKTKHLSSERLFEIREEMGYRYPIDSGAAFRLIWRVPKRFLLKKLVSQIVDDPQEIFGYFKGLSRKKIKTSS